jgi:hypothetical protein
MHGAADRGQVVLAEGLERNVAQDDDVVGAADLLEGPLQDRDRVLRAAAQSASPDLEPARSAR